ncbi:hypothetical protein Vretimale_5829 [Volvox reticuliferus]|uniref:Fructose-1-6-bisphosphatase class I N-terminal domain-containing protein n=1 Tax=Volvox reticuliferus TaxID=1737510 RepID=A0A8J4C633_9CHLO|nr:hypothetical protein Vretifemale_5902 [Volvox reticuliferus]GIM01002.1 hypothetical protein Vretimale_5829 [Volvox reticuliferus]
MQMTLDPKHLQGVEPELAQVLSCVASVVGEISGILRSAGSGYCGSMNAFGDQQLEVDVQVDCLIFERLASCSAVQGAGSEEQPEIRTLPGSGYTVVFDPLDGSSIMGANFPVGTIFGIWPGGSPVGRAGRQQVAAAYAVYGPQTILVWAKPRAGKSAVHTAANGDNPNHEDSAGLDAKSAAAAPEAALSNSICSSGSNIHNTHEVHEFLLHPDGSWHLKRVNVAIGPVSRTFAPANLRAAGSNAEYAALVRRWTEAAFTLRLVHSVCRGLKDEIL